MTLTQFQVLKDMSIQFTIIVTTDSSAAKGIASRLGSGIVNLETRTLWIQDKVADNTLATREIGTTDNRADIQIKYLDAACHTKLSAHLPVRRMKTVCETATQPAMPIRVIGLRSTQVCDAAEFPSGWMTELAGDASTGHEPVSGTNPCVWKWSTESQIDNV